jgi:HK97 family phage portal protein
MNFFQKLIKKTWSSTPSIDGLPSVNSIIKPTNLLTFEFIGLRNPTQQTDFDIGKFIELYYKNAHVYSIVNKIATTGASFDYEVEYKDNIKQNRFLDGLKEEYESLFKRTNSEQTFDEFLTECFIQYSITGACFIKINKSIGYEVPTSLEVLATEFVNILRQNPIDKESTIIGYEYTYGLSIKRYSVEDVIVIKNSSPTKQVEKGVSPFYPALLSILSSNQIAEAENSIIQNKGAVGMIVQKGEYPLTPSERRDLDDNLKSRIGGSSNMNKIITVNSEVDYIDMGKSPKDLELSALDINALRRICNTFNVPSVLFNDPSNTKYNNMSEAMKDFYTGTVIPLAEKFVDAFNYSPIFKDKPFYLCLDYSYIEILQKDKKAEAEKNLLLIEGINQIITLYEKGYSAEMVKAVFKSTMKDMDDEDIDLIISQLKNKKTIQNDL